MMRFRSLLLLLACAVVACASFAATAGARRGWRRGYADQAGWLGLTPPQHQVIHEADPDFDAEARALSARLCDQRRALAGMLEAPNVDDDAALAQVERVIEAHNALERRVARHVLAIRPHLDAGQQAQLLGLCARGLRRGAEACWGSDRDAADPHIGGLGPGRGGRGRGRGAASDGDPPHRAAIHELLDRHRDIRRSVTDIPGGIEATTVSDVPEVTRLLRQHVEQMKQRLEEGRLLRGFDPLFREIFRHHDKIRLEVTQVPGGVSVRETADDPAVVALIRQHAHRAVSEFVQQGPARGPQATPLPEGYGNDELR